MLYLQRPPKHIQSSIYRLDSMTSVNIFGSKYDWSIISTVGWEKTVTLSAKALWSTYTVVSSSFDLYIVHSPSAGN